MKLSILFLFSLFLIQDNQVEVDKSDFIGTWKWVNSELVSEAGIFITTPETEDRTESIVITEDYQLVKMLNGSVTCQSNFVLDLEWDTENPFRYKEINCSIGSMTISNDTLETYAYLGCPSMSRYYVKVKPSNN